MTENLANSSVDTKNTNRTRDDDIRVSYTSRFKITSSTHGRPKTRFGVCGKTEMGVTNSGASKDEKPQPEKEQDKETTQKTPSTSVLRSSRSGHSLFTVANEWRSRRVKFYRNGDRFFKGMPFAVSSERFRTFESLLTALTASAVCDTRVIPNGVRHIFSLDGARHIQSVDELKDGESYVCASADSFRAVDYGKIEDFAWNSRVFVHHEPKRGLQKKTQNKTSGDTSWQNSETVSAPATQGQSRMSCVREQRSCRSHSEKSDTNASERKVQEEFQRTFVSPRLVTLVRNGRRPRKVFRLLLNKKTAQSLEQVMSDITEIISFDCGQAKKVYAMSGQQVMCLADFFQTDTVFLVCAHDRPRAGDFTLDSQETRQTQIHRPFTGKVRDPITLRGSSQASSKSSRSSLSTSKDVSHENTPRLQPEYTEVNQQQAEIKTDNTENVESFVSRLPMPKVLTNKYEVGKLIGTGNFAVVMECRDRKTKRKYALKIINREFCKGKEDMIDNEVRILRCMKHANIIRLVEDFSNRCQIFYVMELVQGGDLFDAISSSTGKYTEHDASSMLYNLASALQYLHCLHIVHRDVKPENILIRQHGDGTKSLKLGDFGLATEVRAPLYTVCGTPTYVAPEVIAETGYGLKIDVWSAGVIAYILLCGFPPFASPSDDQGELFDQILAGSFDYPSPHWDDISTAAKNVITAMLEINPIVRMSATQVLQQKWVSRDNQYEADLRKNVSRGLGANFRRGPRSCQRHAGIKIIATTALDKASKFFRGRGTPQPTVQGRETLPSNHVHCRDRN